MSDENDRAGQLKKLLADCWAEYDRLEEQQFVVRPSIPILFFGDSERYLRSRLRVVTVGLNPSRIEFPDDDRFARFPAVRERSNQRDHSRHLEALNAYFRTKPYRWFDCFAPILKGLGSGYDNSEPSGALHTDLCSPIATDPTWSRLGKDRTMISDGDGVDIWHKLIEILAPQIILISIAKEHLQRIRFKKSSRQAIWRLDRNPPYEVVGTVIAVNSSQQSLLVFGTAAQTPFGTVSNKKKLAMGTAIKEFYYASQR